MKYVCVVFDLNVESIPIDVYVRGKSELYFVSGEWCGDMICAGRHTCGQGHHSQKYGRMYRGNFEV